MTGMGQVILLVSSTAVTAFCIWLVLRICNRREKWAKRLAIWAAAVVLAGYPLSVGPACWISSHTGRGAGNVSRLFQPIFSIWWNGPKPADRVIAWYATLFAAEDWTLASSGQWTGYRWGEFPPMSCMRLDVDTAKAISEGEDLEEE